MTFHLTPKQEDAQKIISGLATHILLEGGGRSGKTFLHVRNTVMRGLKAPASRHAMLRFRFNHIKQSIILDTLPKVMKLAFPGVEYELNKTDWFLSFENESQIYFGGLDDKERTEKILGMEFATIYLNECSQIPYNSQQMVVTRLAQKALQQLPGRAEKPLKPRMFYDWNPSTKAHWVYKIFHQGVDPDSGKPLSNPQDYVHFKINPEDNLENISESYLDTLEGMSAAMRRRFKHGEAAEATPNALFDDVTIEKWRHTHGELPDMVRVVIGVDPSGSGDINNADNDEIGIVAGGLGTDGNAYLFEDATVKAGPATWGSVAAQSYDRHEADVMVGETNFGGAMVEYVIQTQRPRTNFKMVNASRGKVVRAEPFSALYAQGKVRHVGYHQKLEEELCSFSTAGYTGPKSPNRADAWIWVLTELFAGIVKEKKIPPKGGQAVTGRTSFMAN
jgi:hypothetical protein